MKEQRTVAMATGDEWVQETCIELTDGTLHVYSTHTYNPSSRQHSHTDMDFEDSTIKFIQKKIYKNVADIVWFKCNLR